MKKIKHILLIITACIIMGCQSPFFKSTQGTFLNAGLSIPTQSTIDLQIVSYLSGENIFIKDKSSVDYEFTSAETNSYFGLIKTEIYRNGKIKVK